MDCYPPPPKFLAVDSSNSNTENIDHAHSPNTSSPISASSLQLTCPNKAESISAILCVMTATLGNLSDEVIRMRERIAALESSVDILNHRVLPDANQRTRPFPFPMSDVEEIVLLNSEMEKSEFMSQMIAYLSQIGGNTLSECVRNIMLTCLTNNLVKKLNWRGVNNKYRLAGTPFARAVIKVIMRKGFVGCTESLIIQKLRRWIQRGKERDTGSKQDNKLRT